MRLHLTLLRKRTLLPGLLLLLPAAASSAAITEPEAVAAALQNNPGYRQSQAALDAAQGRLLDGVSAFLPSVLLSGHYNRLNEPQFSAGIPSSFLQSVPPSFTTDHYFDALISVKQPLFAWGGNWARFRQGRLDFELAKVDLRLRKSETIYQTRILYYRALLTTATAAIARESMELSQRRLAVSQEQERRGKVSQYDLNRATVALTNDRVAVSRAENDHQRALSALRHFIGASAEVTVEGTLPFDQRDHVLGPVLTEAQDNNPGLIKARLSLERAQADWSAARAEWLPSVFLSYSRTFQRPYADPDAGWDARWQAQLGVEWNALNGLSSLAGMQRAGGGVAGAEAGVAAAESDLDQDVHSAFLDYTQALESLQLQKANIGLAERNFSIAEEKFKLGLIPVLELQDVQLALSQARLNQQQALYDYAIALATLDRLRGILPQETTP